MYIQHKNQNAVCELRIAELYDNPFHTQNNWQDSINKNQHKSMR